MYERSIAFTANIAGQSHPEIPDWPRCDHLNAFTANIGSLEPGLPTCLRASIARPRYIMRLHRESNDWTPPVDAEFGSPRQTAANRSPQDRTTRKAAEVPGLADARRKERVDRRQRRTRRSMMPHATGHDMRVYTNCAVSHARCAVFACLLSP